MEGLGERLPPKVLDHCQHLTQDMLPLLFLGTLFCVMLQNINGIQTPVILIYINNNFEANITHLCPMSNGLMLSFSPADQRALWLASDNSCLYCAIVDRYGQFECMHGQCLGIARRLVGILCTSPRSIL